MNTIELSGLQGRIVKVECARPDGPLRIVTRAGGRAGEQSAYESWVRIGSALKACGIKGHGTWFVDADRIEPAFDLALALAIAVPDAPEDVVAFGELALDGRLPPTRGAFPRSEAAVEAPHLFVGLADAERAAASGDVVAVAHLAEAIAIVRGEAPPAHIAEQPVEVKDPAGAIDFGDVIDTPSTRRAVAALQVSAATGASVLLAGAAGAGKMMLARRAPGLLPPLTDEEAREILRVYDVAGLARGARVKRPFRAPHYTTSEVALVGGGPSPVRPGEVSLAHNGVLFLDEVPELRRRTIEALCEPMRDGRVTFARSREHVEFPARFMLVATMNPCPCGCYSRPRWGWWSCCCSAEQRCAYRARLAPLGFDLVVEIEAANANSAARLPGTACLPNTAILREQVAKFQRDGGDIEAACEFFGVVYDKRQYRR